jgi:predicted TIM-barrel enzyme
VARVREAVPDAPVWVGSGVTPETLPGLAPQAAGFIVGSWMQTHGRAGGRVDPERARRMAAAVGRLREVD